MTVFRWIMGLLTFGFGAASLASLVLFLALDQQLWLARARAARRGLYVVALFWFNIEIWGRVAWTLLHWR